MLAIVVAPSGQRVAGQILAESVRIKRKLVFPVNPSERNMDVAIGSILRKIHPMAESASKQPVYRGGCHCGRIAYEVIGPIDRAEQCNCSICAKKAYIHWIVERDRFRLLTPWEDLATYTFNTHTAKHHFCPRCGVAPFYIARSDPDKIDVNLRCVEDVDLAAVAIDQFDGRNWEAARKARLERRSG